MAPHPDDARRYRSERLVNIYLMFCSLVLAAMIAVMVLLVIHVSAVASANDRNAVTACNLANANRAEDVAIFHDILALPALASPQFITPANMARQRAAVAAIDAAIKAAYAPRDCIALYSTK